MAVSAQLRFRGERLSTERTSFVGRRAERTELRELLGEFRLVTVTGVGGVGKTRLAMRVAAETRRAYPDGVCVVELARLRDPRLVAHTVAAAFGCQPRGSAEPSSVALGAYLEGRDALLVLDNCEHVVEACAELVDLLMTRCPRLRILATSRESLRVEGEATYVVAPLPVGGGNGDGAGADPHLPCDATTLFVERARAVRPDFALTWHNRAAVGDICRRLEGIPLAIELAAVKTRALSPAEILARLTTPTALLRHDGRTVADRQRTLRACVAWSFDLCTPQERLLWARLSVFAGDFELDAAEGVCGEGLAEPFLDLVFALVDKSILTFEPGPERGRLRLLEMLRQYGQERLEHDIEWRGEWQVLRRRHHDWYAGLAARAEAEWTGPAQRSWVSRLRADHANLQLALEFCAATPDLAANLALARSLHRYWVADGWFTEGRYWLARLLDDGGSGAGGGSGRSGGPGGAGGAGDAGRDEAGSGGGADVPGRVRALHTAGWLATLQGDRGDAERMLEHGSELVAAGGAGAEAALITQLTGLDAVYTDKPDAVANLERALAQFRRDGDLNRQQETLAVLTLAAALGSTPWAAQRYYQDWVAMAQLRRDRRLRAYAEWARALATWRAGDPKGALAIARAAVFGESGLPDHLGLALCLEALAWIRASLDEFAGAAVLLGAADHLWERMGTSTAALPGLFRLRQDCEAACREGLGPRAFDAAWARGAALAPAEAWATSCATGSATASAAATDTGPVTGSSSGPTAGPVTRPTAGPVAVPAGAWLGGVRLTRRERQVAQLVAQGLSNRDIAATLVISPRTAETHVQQILKKLGLTSRAQVAAWLSAQPAETAG
ncbi:Predicted ATPase [Parafrankia irregularis]|uniref:Predicted ATPase n=1 Tax=Parafrankia irregularis TaxID=795642 RepID=A0A0S4QHG6_9ACTN|nr:MULTISPECIES: LuxR C-terminal-related transcriptional regulator [Parafrankia]MBE3200698.1 LuxR family transcriptional regulator [Parafrankia sp. CH37]CUU54919.1 Predicted ATPase [Parafrankia irregularis]